MTPETRADVTALLRLAYARLTDLEARSPGRVHVSQEVILATFKRLDRAASTEGMQRRQGAHEAVDVSALVARLEGLEAQLMAHAEALGELRAAPARELPEHQGEPEGPGLAALREGVASLESADNCRQGRLTHSAPRPWRGLPTPQEQPS
jgi:hypothetical protein